MKNISIGGKMIGLDFSPFIIAEMSGNHNQSLERAFKMIEAAAKAGVDAVKIQTYTADTMTLNIHKDEFQITDSESLWHGKSLYELYNEAYTPWEWHKPIFDYCKKLGLIAFSSPFDESAVDFLESLEVPCYKIASFENTDLPLIRKVASTGKPIIISTGMAKISELDEAVRTAEDHGAKDIILLKCTSTYPASPEYSNLMTIPHLQSLFGYQVGLSDHTLGIGVSIASIPLGARVIEKHFTLSRNEGGVDSAFSLEPHELKALVDESKHASQALGSIFYGVSKSERKSLLFKRSIYITEDLKAGDILTENNIRIVRPGLGLEPKFLNIVLGKKLSIDVKRGTPLTWELI